MSVPPIQPVNGLVVFFRKGREKISTLDAQYAKEQDGLSGEIDGLEKAISGFEQSKKSAEKFITLVEKYENFDTLTTTMLNEQERGTQGQAAPELFTAQGQRQAKRIRGQNQVREAAADEGQESGPPRRGHGKRRVLYCGQRTAAGAARKARYQPATLYSSKRDTQ